ncbi:sensor histidine kinase [uncultured Thermanaerothrix sp.]|uniref:sensor histidine kinase n=1 Tax=uncultured Thermanaerothrix sp. TaxID=1195149 RepID=UPI002624F7BC|nr:sensor histidine kinase [uncultured Thermanaerothrix sp.]
MSMETQVTNESDAWESFIDFIASELEQARRVHYEVTEMIERSQVELTRLTQRNASINAHLQQLHAQFDSVPRSDIRVVYDSALDAQRRLLVMRSQVEKLQSDQAHLEKYIQLLEKVQDFVGEGSSAESGRRRDGGMAMLEKLIDAQEAERQKLSRQMHDGPAQDLSNFIVQAEIVARLFDLDPLKAREELENLKNAAMATFQKVRLFITGLRPMMLDDLGLFITVQRYGEAFSNETGAEVNVMTRGAQQRFAPYAEVMIFRAIQELMNNAYRHNQDMLRKLMIEVFLEVGDQFVKVVVRDDGKGFDLHQLQESGGLGLRLIRERVEMLGGSVDIDTAPGQGCRVTLQIPLNNITL